MSTLSIIIASFNSASCDKIATTISRDSTWPQDTACNNAVKYWTWTNFHIATSNDEKLKKLVS